MDETSPLPPPIFPHGHGASLAQAEIENRPSWRSRVALAVVAILLVGAIAAYLAKPSAVRQILAVDWLPSWQSVTASKPGLVEQSTQQERPAAQTSDSETSLPAADDSAAIIDALRRELALTTARLRESEREPIVTQV